MSTNYKGSTVNKLFAAVEKNPDMSMGEILHSILHKNNLNGKHFFYASDKEIYNAVEWFTKLEEEVDEPLTTNEFEFWVEGKKFGTK